MQKPLNTGNKCINPKCKTQQDEKLIRPMFAPIDQLCEILGTDPTAHQAFVLCRKCYNETYSIVFELRKPCSSCGAIPKASTVFNRHSPNAEAVTQHLKTAGHNATISPTDCLCFGCYKMHCAIMETLKSEGNDDTLKQDIEKWMKKYNEPTQTINQVWLQEIRRLVSNRITTEEERVPSVTSLWRHWLRSSWIYQMWQCSHHCDMYSSLSPPEDSGWTICEDGKYTIDWEA